MIRAVVLAIGLFGAMAGGMWYANSHREVRVTKPGEAFVQLIKALEDERGLYLEKLDCTLFYTRDYPYGACYGSNVDTEDLVAALGQRLSPLAFSPGWRQDYGTWASFYELRDGSKVTFGVSVTPTADNPDFQQDATLRRYAQFVTVTVNDQP